jgi:hypothetical protein
VGAQDAPGRAGGQRHGPHEAPDGAIHQPGIVTKTPCQPVMEQGRVLTRTLAHGLVEGLGDLVVGQHRMDLSRMGHHQRGHLGQHAPAQVGPVRETLAMDQLVQHHVVIPGLQLREGLNLHEVDRVVVQITGGEQSAPIRKVHGAASSRGIRAQAGRGPLEQFRHALGIQVIDGQARHGSTTAATKHRPVPVAPSIATGIHSTPGDPGCTVTRIVTSTASPLAVACSSSA